MGFHLVMSLIIVSQFRILNMISALCHLANLFSLFFHLYNSESIFLMGICYVILTSITKMGEVS